MPRLEHLADGDGGVDQADVGVGLREVAEQPAGLGLDVLREQPQRVGVRHQPVEQLHGVVDAADHGQRLGPPERADGEGAGRRPEVVGVVVALHQAGGREPLLVGAHRRDEPRIVRVDEAERRQQQVRRVGMTAVERLGEEAELLVVGRVEHPLVLGLGPRPPRRGEVAAAAALGHVGAARRRHPAQHLGEGVVPGHRPVLPQPGVFADRGAPSTRRPAARPAASSPPRRAPRAGRWSSCRGRASARP